MKGRLKDALADGSLASENVTASVRIPLTHYIRIAQFNAAASGLLAGLFLGVLLGGWGVFFTLSRFKREQLQTVRPTHATRSPYVRMLLEDNAPLTPLERVFLKELDDKEPHRGPK